MNPLLNGAGLVDMGHGKDVAFKGPHELLSEYEARVVENYGNDNVNKILLICALCSNSRLGNSSLLII